MHISDIINGLHVILLHPSQFNHPNILSLLGVCLQNEPQFLILELMEGGDLRSYLMGARPGPVSTPETTPNLISLHYQTGLKIHYHNSLSFT